jgi:DNA invertase Pin-like site-specific DNA recombinase
MTSSTIKVARIYIRVSTDEQDLQRQEAIIADAKAAGYYVAAVYREKASGARADRVELLRMVADLQPGEVVIAEKIDRISRLPLPEAERLVASIRVKGARLAVPGVVDLSDLAAEAQGVAKIVLESVQDMLLKLALQMARDDYEDRRERQRQGIELAKAAGKYRGRRADAKRRAQVIALRSGGQSINKTAKLTGYSPAQVKRIWAERGQAEAKQRGAFMEDALTEADALAGGRQDEPALLDDEGPSAEVLRFITTTTARELYGLRPGETVAQAAARKARDDRTGLGEGAA